MANSYDRADLRKLQKKYWQLRTKVYITTQTERKIRDRDQVAVFEGRKKRKGLQTFDNDWCNIKTEDRYPCRNGASVVSIVFDSLHIFIRELVDYLLPIKMVI